MTPILGLIILLMVLALTGAGLWLYRYFDRRNPANLPDHRPGAPGTSVKEDRREKQQMQSDAEQNGRPDFRKSA